MASERPRFAMERMQEYVSSLDIANDNIASQRCAVHGHRLLGAENWRRQKGEQLLRQGVGELNAVDAPRRSTL